MNDWTSKRNKILKRDNYTCQICKNFNPELGTVQVTNHDGAIEFHEYINQLNPANSVYTISQCKSGYTFEIMFGDCWPVFPIMQVHHLKYVKGQELWDYNDQDLITLCKKCHYRLHLKNLIPIFNQTGELIDKKKFVPVDSGSGRQHDCDEWTFIKKVGGGEYVLSNIEPTITFVAFADENQEEIFKEGQIMLDKFIKNFFPRYSKK